MHRYGSPDTCALKRIYTGPPSDRVPRLAEANTGGRCSQGRNRAARLPIRRAQRWRHYWRRTPRYAVSRGKPSANLCWEETVSRATYSPENKPQQHECQTLCLWKPNGTTTEIQTAPLPDFSVFPCWQILGFQILGSTIYANAAHGLFLRPALTGRVLWPACRSLGSCPAPTRRKASDGFCSFTGRKKWNEKLKWKNRRKDGQVGK